jgi:large subunit ribosomal protein L18
MNTTLRKKLSRRSRIRKGIRNKITGTSEKPRLSIYRSNRDIYAQIIDDVSGVTLVYASSRVGEHTGKPVEKAVSVGKELASKALEANINQVKFDRNGYLFHGRVKALADGAREGGLQF